MDDASKIKLKVPIGGITGIDEKEFVDRTLYFVEDKEISDAIIDFEKRRGKFFNHLVIIRDYVDTYSRRVSVTCSDKCSCGRAGLQMDIEASLFVKLISIFSSIKLNEATEAMKVLSSLMMKIKKDGKGKLDDLTVFDK